MVACIVARIPRRERCPKVGHQLRVFLADYVQSMRGRWSDDGQVGARERPKTLNPAIHPRGTPMRLVGTRAGADIRWPGGTLVAVFGTYARTDRGLSGHVAPRVLFFCHLPSQLSKLFPRVIS